MRTRNLAHRVAFVTDGDNAGGDTQPADPPKDSDKDKPKFTDADLKRVIDERVRREREKYADYSDLQNAAARLKEIEDRDKSAQEKAAEEIARAQREVEKAKADAIRFKAAATYGITGDDINLVPSGTESDVNAAAERIGTLIAAERELASLKGQQSAEEKKRADQAAQQQQGRPVPRQWQPGATPVEVNPGPSAKDRAAAMAASQWGVPLPGAK